MSKSHVRLWIAFLCIACWAGEARSQDLGLVEPRLTEPPAGSPLDGAQLDEKTEQVASTVRCPVCQGLSVADSPTESALAIKTEMRELLGAGYSDEQVLSYLERSYGEFIRLSPRARGFNLVVWIAPVLAVALGFWLVIARLRRPAVARAERSADASDDLAPYLDRVREEYRG